MKKDYKPYCVVDAENRYKTLVLASKENGQEEIQYYKLAEGPGRRGKNQAQQRK